MAINLQAQRIPLGTVTIGGREMPVYITVEWLKVLRVLDGTVTVIEEGGGSGAPAQTAIELPYEDATAVKVLAIALQRAVSALESDTTVLTLRAQMAALAARVEGLEQAS